MKGLKPSKEKDENTAPLRQYSYVTATPAVGMAPSRYKNRNARPRRRAKTSAHISSAKEDEEDAADG